MNKLMFRNLLTVALIALFGSAVALESDESLTVVQGLTADEDFSIFVTLLDRAGLTADLQGAGPYTIFAPSNDAFEEMGQETLNVVSSDAALLEKILRGHVVQGRFELVELANLDENVDSDSRIREGDLTSLQGEALEFDIDMFDGLEVNGVDLVSTDVDNSYSNGIVHVVDEVILPRSVRDQATRFGEDADSLDDLNDSDSRDDLARASEPTLLAFVESDERFDTFRRALNEAEFGARLDDEGPYTVFIPTDEAFEALSAEERDALFGDRERLRRVLAYHVVREDLDRDMLGERDSLSSLEGSTIDFGRMEDLNLDEPTVIANGYVYVVDRVFIPASLQGALTAERALTSDLTQALESEQRFGRFVQALRDSDVLGGLQDGRTYTIFVPTDEAFERLSRAMTDRSQLTESERRNMLLHHVLSGKVMRENLVGDRPGNVTYEPGEARDGLTTTLSDSELLLTLENDGAITVDNRARVIDADIEVGENIVIHVIDEVLLPNTVTEEER